MKKYFIKSLLLISSMLIFLMVSIAQKTNIKPEINIGIAARAFTIELAKYNQRSSREFGFDYDQLKLARNRSLGIDIGQRFYEQKLYLGLSTYIRYGHFHFKNNSTNSGEINRFKYDIFLDANYYIKYKKTHKSSLILGIGLGYMNLNTRFTYEQYTGEIDSNGNFIKRSVKSGFDFFAPRLTIGLDRNRFKLFFITHGTPDNDYRSNPSIWLEFKASYLVKTFKKS